MVDFCTTWSLPGDRPRSALCSMEHFRETERVMKNACPACIHPGVLLPPKGCCLCDAVEEFPPRWEFATPFAASGTYAVTSPRTWTGTTCLGRVEPPGSGFATVTRDLYRPSPDDYVPLPLIRTVASAAGNPVAVCGWTNGRGRVDGWYWHASHKGGACPITTGVGELRCSFSFSGAYVRPDGSTSGGSYGLSGCLWPTSAFKWESVPEFPGRIGTPMTSDLWYDFLTCAAYPANVRVKKLFTPQVCWQWYLTCGSFLGAGTNTIRLHLSATGYSYAHLDRIIYVDGPLGSVPIHDDLHTGSQICFQEPGGPHFGGLLSPLGGGLVWEGVYPCNEPSLITLTTATPSPSSGLFQGLTFPTIIKLRAVR